MRSTTPAVRLLLVLVATLVVAGCSDGGGSGGGPPGGTSPTSIYPTSGDPGTEEWVPVAADRVAEECKLDPALLAQADAQIGLPWAVVRYGRLCHEYYPDGPQQVDETTEVFSTTKTLGALATGVVAWQTQDVPSNGRKTGPLTATDRVDHWLDEFSFNPDAQVAHVLAMIAHNADLSYGARRYQYDIDGRVQINRLSDVVNTVVAQDPERLGADIEEFTQRYLFQPLGMRLSRWSNGSPSKTYAFSWSTTVREMARIGLLVTHGGVWSGERLLGEDWIYAMTRPSFEDSNTGYGYLTWLNTLSANGGRTIECAPLTVNHVFPHGLSEAPDCGYASPADCEQDLDVGPWYAAGLFGQYILGHPALDLVLVVKNFDPVGDVGTLWDIFRPALIALDPEYAGDEAAFCDAYDRGAYAPDLK